MKKYNIVKILGFIFGCYFGTFLLLKITEILYSADFVNTAEIFIALISFVLSVALAVVLAFETDFFNQDA